jgi:hypothetical protein
MLAQLDPIKLSLIELFIEQKQKPKPTKKKKV